MSKKSNRDEFEDATNRSENQSLNDNHTERNLENELKKFHVLYDLAIAMTADNSLDENLQLVVDKSRELFSTDTAYIALKDETGDDIVMHTFSGIHTEAFKQLQIPFGKGLGGLILKTRKGYIVEDYFSEKSLDRIADNVVADEGVISRIAVPIQMGSDNLGVLYVSNRTKTVFSQSDLDMLFLIANLAAMEITRKRAIKQLRIAHSRLERRVEDRTAKLVEANKKLKQQIKKRNVVEEKLRQSEKRYRALFEDSPISLWEQDYSEAKRHIDELRNQGVKDFRKFFDDHPKALRKCQQLIGNIDVNRATLQLYEAKSKEELFANLDAIYPDPHDSIFKEKCIAISNSKMFETECINKTLTGKEINVLIKTSIPPGYENTWSKVFISIHDLTERVRVENEQKRLEAQLQQAQKMEAIGTLAGGIAHDFNNILAAIIGYTELSIFHVPDDSKAKNSLRKVLKAGDRAKNLVNQILSFSRQGDQSMRLVSINSILKESLKLLRASLPSTIEIRKHIDNDIGPIEADPTQIHQVLINLCSNAAHAMREKGGVLEISLTKVRVDSENPAKSVDMLPGPYLKLSVKDTGHGIPPELMKRIFEPYFTTKKMNEGTGLGLAVVHGIVKSCGFNIHVESEPGKGTMFQVFFPYSQKELNHSNENHTTEENNYTGKERILFIDDEQALVDIGKEILGYLGYKVVAVTSSIQAFDLFKLEPNQFDLVITDMTMPNMTGVMLAEEILKIRSDIPIILCTGFSDVITPEKAQAIGISEFVLKPLVIKDLAEIIRKVLDKK
ncbi:MAG: response regulator [Desulfobacterales bacterium]|nr:response regulator [Desulfobacterales bacterium]